MALSWTDPDTVTTGATIGDLIEFERTGYNHWAVYTGTWLAPLVSGQLFIENTQLTKLVFFVF